jgi:hypothetical protein
MRVITPELAKALLDALHDSKHLQPHYRTTGHRAPLADDNQSIVIGLAVELLVDSETCVDFTLAESLRPTGTAFGAVEVVGDAPNDIAASSREEVARQAVRADFARAVSAAWTEIPPEAMTSASCLVVRHGPQRDEDNTWATWVGVLTRGGSWRDSRAPSPMEPTWRPRAIASVCATELTGRVRYEFYK